MENPNHKWRYWYLAGKIIYFYGPWLNQSIPWLWVIAYHPCHRRWNAWNAWKRGWSYWNPQGRDGPGRAGTGRDSRDPGDWRKMFSALFVEEDVPVLSMCCYFVVLFIFFVGYSSFSKYTQESQIA